MTHSDLESLGRSHQLYDGHLQRRSMALPRCAPVIHIAVGQIMSAETVLLLHFHGFYLNNVRAQEVGLERTQKDFGPRLNYR